MSFDEKLCQEIPEIDVILGSHTHHHFNHGEVNNGVLMAAAEIWTLSWRSEFND